MRKLNEVRTDADSEKQSQIRAIDESGEDFFIQPPYLIVSRSLPMLWSVFSRHKPKWLLAVVCGNLPLSGYLAGLVVEPRGYKRWAKKPTVHWPPALTPTDRLIAACIASSVLVLEALRKFLQSIGKRLKAATP